MVRHMVEEELQKNYVINHWLKYMFDDDIRHYPYYHGPLLSDLKGLSQTKVRFQKDLPFTPFDQLLSVLPPRRWTLMFFFLSNACIKNGLYGMIRGICFSISLLLSLVFVVFVLFQRRTRLLWTRIARSSTFTLKVISHILFLLFYVILHQSRKSRVEMDWLLTCGF